MIAYPVYQDIPYEVTVFLKTKPQIFAVLEMLVSVVMIVFIISSANIWFIVSPVFYILTGSVIVLAACKHNVCLVKTAQAFNYINMVVIAVSFRFHLVFSFKWSVPVIVFLVCDVLVLIISIVIASAFCACCCRPKSRGVAVSYVSTTVPVNSIGLLNHSDPSASPQPVSSVMYVLPAAYGQVPYSPPPSYSQVTPAPSYSPVPTAPPAYYSSVPTVPPPVYEQASAFAPPELKTQGKVDQIDQYVK